MSINSEDFPIHHVTWFDLSQLVDKIELSTFYICEVVQVRLECIKLQCLSQAFDTMPEFKYENYRFDLGQKDEMTNCLITKLGVEYCDYI